MYLFGFPQGLQGGSKETVYSTSRPTNRVTSRATSRTTSYGTHSPTSRTTSWISNWNTNYLTTHDTMETTTYSTLSSWSTSRSTTTSWDTFGTTSQNTVITKNYYYDGRGKEFYSSEFAVIISNPGSWGTVAARYQRTANIDSNGRYGTVQNWSEKYTSEIDDWGIAPWTADGDPLANVGKGFGFSQGQAQFIIGEYKGDWGPLTLWDGSTPITGRWAYGLKVVPDVPKVLYGPDLLYTIDPVAGTFPVPVPHITAWSTPLNNTSYSTNTVFSASTSWATDHQTAKATNYSTSHSTSQTTSGATNYNTIKTTSRSTVFSTAFSSNYTSVFDTSHITYG